MATVSYRYVYPDAILWCCHSQCCYICREKEHLVSPVGRTPLSDIEYIWYVRVAQTLISELLSTLCVPTYLCLDYIAPYPLGDA